MVSRPHFRHDLRRSEPFQERTRTPRRGQFHRTRSDKQEPGGPPCARAPTARREPARTCEPAHTLTTSASRLDPDISPANAALQVPRMGGHGASGRTGRDVAGEAREEPQFRNIR
jgi:hypothetical protein